MCCTQTVYVCVLCPVWSWCFVSLSGRYYSKGIKTEMKSLSTMMWTRRETRLGRRPYPGEDGCERVMWQQLRNANRRTKAFNKYDCRCMNVCGSVVISMCVCVCVLWVWLSVFVSLFTACLFGVCCLWCKCQEKRATAYSGKGSRGV